MKPADAAKEILALARDSARLGGLTISADLKTFVDELAVSPGLKAVRKSKTPQAGDSSATRPRVGARAERSPEANMSKTIDELAQKLREAFNSDDRFETVLSDPQTQKLSKANVVTLYARVFDAARPLSKSMTKPEVFNAIRRERISRVRSGY